MTGFSERFSTLVERVAHQGIDPWALHWRARTAAAAGEDVIVLSVGDPDIAIAPPIVETAIRQLRAGDSHYTESSGRPRVRAAVAARHQLRTGQAVSADNVTILVGAQNALFTASLCLAQPGDEVIAIDPMYATYPATLQVSGARLVRAPAPASQGFRPDLGRLEQAVNPRTRALFLTTPNNPSGIILNEEEVRTIVELARRRDLWIVSDEVYGALAPGGRIPSLAKALPEQTITICSLSKTHAMPGWRAGWIVGPTSFIHHADELAQCMLYGLPGFVQEAMITALDHADAIEASVRNLCQERSTQFYEALQGIPGIRPLKPDAGMFLLIDVRPSGLSCSHFVEQLFEQQGLSLLEGTVFGNETHGFVRACIAAEPRTLEDAAARIRRFCHALPRPA